MLKAMYFHPFLDPNHNTGSFLGSWPSALSLHFVAPTISRRGTDFCYLRTMGNASTTFQAYTKPSHRIYVMGHGAAGSNSLSTETGSYETCTANELARHFFNHGLLQGSQVQIRIHACHSGAPSAPNAHDSFAEQFRDAMRNLGAAMPYIPAVAGVQYPNVTVRGYTEAVGMYLGQRWAGWEPANNVGVDF